MSGVTAGYDQDNGRMRTPEEIRDMRARLEDNIHEHGWDAAVDAASNALRWALGGEPTMLEHALTRPDAERRAEWIARGGDPKDWPTSP